jgi:hypothetical protein
MDNKVILFITNGFEDEDNNGCCAIILDWYLLGYLAYVKVNSISYRTHLTNYCELINKYLHKIH